MRMPLMAPPVSQHVLYSFSESRFSRGPTAKAIRRSSNAGSRFAAVFHGGYDGVGPVAQLLLRLDSEGRKGSWGCGTTTASGRTTSQAKGQAGRLEIAQ